MWPPTEIPLKVNVNSRLMPSQSGRPVCMTSTPRARSSRMAAPKSPNTAADAPTVNESGVTIRAPNEPASSATT